MEASGGSEIRGKNRQKILALPHTLLYNIQAMNLTGGPLAGQNGSRYERCEGKEEIQWQMY